jgi:hypothetical protein
VIFYLSAMVQSGSHSLKDPPSALMFCLASGIAFGGQLLTGEKLKVVLAELGNLHRRGRLVGTIYLLVLTS